MTGHRLLAETYAKEFLSEVRYGGAGSALMDLILLTEVAEWEVALKTFLLDPTVG